PDPATQMLELPLEHARQVTDHTLAVRQLEIPARCVGDRARVPQLVGAVQDRCIPMGASERPVLMEPADMPDLPQYRVDDRQHRSHQLFTRQVLSEAARMAAYLAQLSGESVGASVTRRSIDQDLVHADHYYHTGPPIVTIRKRHHLRALD